MKDLANIKGISRGDRDILIKLKDIVHLIIPTASVLLYGSVARGTQDEESDYDILVLTDAPLSTKEEDAVTDAVYDLELEQGIVIAARWSYLSGIGSKQKKCQGNLDCCTGVSSTVARKAIMTIS